MGKRYFMITSTVDDHKDGARSTLAAEGAATIEQVMERVRANGDGLRKFRVREAADVTADQVAGWKADGMLVEEQEASAA